MMSSKSSNNNKSCLILYYLKDQRYALSNILSYLNENEGTSLLITNRTWSRRLLPLFRLPDNLHKTYNNDAVAVAVAVGGDNKSTKGHGRKSNVRRLNKIRHRYIVMPVQDSSVLLSKLNTKRLAARIKQYQSQSKSKQKNIDNNDSDDNDDRNHKITMRYHNMNEECYPKHLTTEEIAWSEWIQSRFVFMANNCTDNDVMNSSSNNDKNSNGNINTIVYNNKDQWEAKLELLRYRTPPSTYKIPKPNRLTTTLPLPPKIRPQTILLTSYPRSGNTLLRNLLERITNIITGSDTRPDRTLSKSLALDHDLVGEGIVTSNLTPIVKTHYPERKGFAPFNTSRIILLVRNPFDAIDSYWNMCCTNTHTESVTEDVYDFYQVKFDGLVRDEICTWLKFVKYWLDNCNTTFCERDDSENRIGNILSGRKRKKCPSLLIIRFEDLILQTEDVLEQVMNYILEDGGVDNNNHGRSKNELHPFWKWRIRHGLDLTTTDNHVSQPPNQSNKYDNCDVDNCNSTMNKETNDKATIHKADQKNVNTLQLGSYKPRSEKKSSHAAIGKSIRKSRYTQDLLSHMHETSQLEEYLMSMGNEKFSLLELFGYDIPKQDFPHNFDNSQGGCEVKRKKWSFDEYCVNKDTHYPTRHHSKDETSIRVNAGSEIRPSSSPYGRAMTRWRRSQTCDDTEPFPTVKGRIIK